MSVTIRVTRISKFKSKEDLANFYHDERELRLALYDSDRVSDPDEAEDIALGEYLAPEAVSRMEETLTNLCVDDIAKERRQAAQATLHRASLTPAKGKANGAT